jgi:hypothetical protein
MTDAELEEKFHDQAARVLPSDQVRELIAPCWKAGGLSNMRQLGGAGSSEAMKSRCPAA